MKDFVFYNNHCICVDDLQEFYLQPVKDKLICLCLVYTSINSKITFDTEDSAIDFYIALLGYVDAEQLHVEHIEIADEPLVEIETKDSNVISINKKKT